VQCTFATTLSRTRNQSFWRGAFGLVHSCGRKFIKHVHNLFTHALWSSSPAGLRLEISRESDKKKMNFIFNYTKKILLTGKMKRACRRKNKKQCVEKFCEPASTDFESRQRTLRCASRVDRIDVCAQFLASASEA
jgi:hypothetical protein